MSASGWILLLYHLPSKRSSARVGLWRQLKRSGALPLETSGYLVPNRADLAEKFQWFVQQVQDAGGAATLAQVSTIEGLSDEQIIELFQAVRAKDYGEILKELSALLGRYAKKLNNAQLPELERLRRRFAEVQSIDFFNCPRSHDVAMLFEKAARLKEGPAKTARHKTLSAAAYTGKSWLTRPRPEIDRVGSAWLIRRFIDLKATFVFASHPSAHPEAIPYDMMNVEFTHHGDDCTFETLLRKFALADKSLHRIGEMIHDADLEDAKFQTVEAFGIDRVFKGWGRLGLNDDEILSRGFQCFDALFEFLRTQ